MYTFARPSSSPFYTHHTIYSPRVPVFRDDADRLLESPFAASIITSPAVNAGAVRQNEPDNVARIEPIMRERIERVLSIAALHRHRALVLGAWGCGVFKNDPANVAAWFHDALVTSASFRGAFKRINFAVLDRTRDGSVIGPFAERFCGG